MTLVKIKGHHTPRQFSNFMHELMNDFPAGYVHGETGTYKNSVPVNILENETAYLIELAAPGYAKEAFKISVDKQILTIAVEKEAEEQQAEKYISREFVNRSFKRSFTLDEKINAAEIEAKYVNGILTLNLPKKAEVKPEKKEIVIN